MQDTIINLPKWNVDTHRVRVDAATDPTVCVRVYRTTPERVALQVRSAKSYSTASLPLAELDALITALQSARKEIA